MWNTLARQCEVEHILLDVDIREVPALFVEVAKHLTIPAGLSASVIVNSLMVREAMGSTGLGLGVAIPHARIIGLDAPVSIIVRTAHPILFDAPDGKPVDLFFVMLIPDSTNKRHLQGLADAAHLLSDQSFRDALRGSTTPQAVRRILLDWS